MKKLDLVIFTACIGYLGFLAGAIIIDRGHRKINKEAHDRFMTYTDESFKDLYRTMLNKATTEEERAYWWSQVERYKKEINPNFEFIGEA